MKLHEILIYFCSKYILVFKLINEIFVILNLKGTCAIPEWVTSFTIFVFRDIRKCHSLRVIFDLNFFSIFSVRELAGGMKSASVSSKSNSDADAHDGPFADLLDDTSMLTAQ